MTLLTEQENLAIVNIASGPRSHTFLPLSIRPSIHSITLSAIPALYIVWSILELSCTIRRL